MTEDDVIRILCEYFESLFPKVCPNCNRCFATLREYIETTKRIGPSRSYDADMGNWDTERPIGSIALANCPCGSTLALTTEGMPLPIRLELLKWVRIETKGRGVNPSELLEYLRGEVRKRTLGNSTF